MSIVLLLAYATLVLTFGTHSLYRLAIDRRRERWLGAGNFVLLGLVGILSSAAWPLLLAVYATGWLLSREGRRWTEQMRARWPEAPKERSDPRWLRWRILRQGI